MLRFFKFLNLLTLTFLIANGVWSMPAPSYAAQQQDNDPVDNSRPLEIRSDLWMDMFQQLSATMKGPIPRELAEQIPEKIWQVIDVYVDENGTSGPTFISLMELLGESYGDINKPKLGLGILSQNLDANILYFQSVAPARRVKYYSQLAEMAFVSFGYTNVDSYTKMAIEQARLSGDQTLVFHSLINRLNLMFGLIEDEDFTLLFDEANTLGNKLFRSNNPNLTNVKLFQARKALSQGNLERAKELYKDVLSLIRKGASTQNLLKAYWRDRGLIEFELGNISLSNEFLNQAGITFEPATIPIKKFTCTPGDEENWAVFSLKAEHYPKSDLNFGVRPALLMSNGNNDFNTRAYQALHNNSKYTIIKGEKVLKIACVNDDLIYPVSLITKPQFDLGFFEPMAPLGNEILDGLITHLSGVDAVENDLYANLQNLVLLNRLIAGFDEAGLGFDPDTYPLIGDDGAPLPSIGYKNQAGLYFLRGQYFASLNRNDAAIQAFEYASGLLMNEEEADLLNMIGWETLQLTPHSKAEINKFLGHFEDHFVLQYEANRPLDEVLWALVYYAKFILDHADADKYAEGLEKMDVVLEEADDIEGDAEALKNAAQLISNYLKAGLTMNTTREQ